MLTLYLHCCDVKVPSSSSYPLHPLTEPRSEQPMDLVRSGFISLHSSSICTYILTNIALSCTADVRQHHAGDRTSCCQLAVLPVHCSWIFRRLSCILYPPGSRLRFACLCFHASSPRLDELSHLRDHCPSISNPSPPSHKVIAFPHPHVPSFPFR